MLHFERRAFIGFYDFLHDVVGARVGATTWLMGLAGLDAPQQSKFLRRVLKAAHVDQGHLSLRGLLVLHLAAVAHFSTVA